MTIELETRMSFPEGGTECPQEDSPVLVPASSNTSSSSMSNDTITTGDTCATSSSNSNKEVIDESNKSKVPSPSCKQRCKLRSHKQLAAKVEESSVPQILKVILNGEEIDKDEECTNDCSSTGTENNSKDLKKPIKAKRSGADGLKEEAASRKSMRLRLRKGNNDDIYGPKERPRYVEDLTSIDFEDDELKLKFMDALGMSPRPKRPRLEVEATIESPVPSPLPCAQRVDVDKALEIISEVKTGCIESGPSSDDSKSNIAVLINDQEEDKCDLRQSAEIASSSVKSGVLEEPNDNLPKPLETSINEQTSISTSTKDDDDNDGWESWVKRLSSYKTKSVKLSPTKKEIKESLTRLVRLGTAVKVVGSGLS